MSSDELFHVKPSFAAAARVNADRYHVLRNHADQEPDAFWAAEAEARLRWMRAPARIKETSFAPGAVSISWFGDGLLNASETCLDRHLPEAADRIAILWEGDEPGDGRSLTYRELYAAVCRLGNALRGLGVGRGDRVAIYLPMVPEAVVAMLACARIGAIHSVVFGGFSAAGLADRVRDCGAVLLITADEGRRAGRRIPLKRNADLALETCSTVRHAVVVRVTGALVPMQAGRDLDYATLVGTQADACPPEPMGASDPLFVLYTSGSTGKPKGVLHGTAGYLLWAAFTHELVFDHRPGEVFWCTADIGWITGHSYGVYGPLANGATTLMFEGVPTHPDPGRVWRIVDRHRVAGFYTAPTAIRALMREGDAPVRAASRASLRVLGSVGEPIGAEAWLWYHRVVGDGRCPVVDTWWQTETGGILIAPLPGAVPCKPGAATLPLPGIRPVLLSADGAVVEGAGEGLLCLADSWPGQAIGLFDDKQRFLDAYFSPHPGFYCTGDGARRDADGYYWITGRTDDVLNVSGHRLGTAEIEAAIAAHPAVAEAAVVGAPHPVKGEAVHAFVTLRAGHAPDPALRAALVGAVRQAIGALAAPDTIQWAPSLPKTRSGKIMRRLLRGIVAGSEEELGDTSTLANPEVVAALLAGRAEAK